MRQIKVDDWVTPKSSLLENRFTFSKWRVIKITDTNIIIKGVYIKYLPKHIFDSGWELMPRAYNSSLWKVLNG